MNTQTLRQHVQTVQRRLLGKRMPTLKDLALLKTCDQAINNLDSGLSIGGKFFSKHFKQNLDEVNW